LNSSVTNVATISLYGKAVLRKRAFPLLTELRLGQLIFTPAGKEAMSERTAASSELASKNKLERKVDLSWFSVL
jgi:hypothetical protein